MRTTLRDRGRRRAAAIIGAGALTALAACSPANTAAGGQGSATAGPSDAASSAGAVSLEAARSQLAAYVGAQPGKADPAKPPVYLGFITQQGGIPSFPEAKTAADAAVRFINDNLGGVNGHPVKLVTCVVVSSQEEAQNCAQQMAHDARVRVVQLGLLTTGAAAIYATLRDVKPVVGQTPASPTDVTAPGVYFPWPGSYGIEGGIARYLADTLKAKKAAVVYDGDDQGAAFGAKSVAAALGQLGIAHTEVAAQTGSANVATALVSAGALAADAVVRIGNTPSCVPTARAAKQLGVKAPIIALDFCMDDAVRKANGGDLPPWTYVGQTRNVLAPGYDAQSAVYRAVMRAYAPDAVVTGTAPSAWDSIILDAKTLNQLGDAAPTPAAVTRWWQDFHGPVFLGADHVACGFLADKGLPGLCSTTVFLSPYRGGGAWSPSVQVNPQALGITR